jgi:hypothetical protein
LITLPASPLGARLSGVCVGQGSLLSAHVF